MKPVQSSKIAKEDVTKSATFQQFIKTMEHELRRLEENEQTFNVGKWTQFRLFIIFVNLCCVRFKFVIL